MGTTFLAFNCRLLIDPMAPGYGPAKTPRWAFVFLIISLCLALSGVITAGIGHYAYASTITVIVGVCVGVVFASCACGAACCCLGEDE
jgi:hypothetical protein